VVPRFEALPVADLFDQTVAELSPQIEGKNVELRFAATNAVVYSDRMLLKSIHHNLVSNAIRYTSRGRILVGGRRRGPLYRLQIMDTGRGIAPEDQAVIFNEFTRLPGGDGDGENDDDDSYALGLGLSIVKRACELLDHPVSVASEPGRGSVFSVDIPLATTAQLTEQPMLGPSVSSQPAPTGLILLLEDNMATALATRHLVEAWGHRCVVATSENEAESLIRGLGQAPDLILADYDLGGGVTGLEVVDTIVAAAGHTIPTILITANTDGQCREEAEMRGVPVVTKPVRPARLRALISFALLSAETG